jgi:serine phosphatase RsbU (regulator of sigma subunit)
LITLVAGTFSLPEVLDKLAEAAVKILKVKSCCIRLLDDEAGELAMRSTYNLSEEYRDKGPVSKNDKVIKAAFAGEAVVLDDMRVDGRVKYQEAAKKEGLVSQLTVAMVFRDKPIGVLRVYSPKSKRFYEDDISLARGVASQCAAAITNARLYARAVEGARMAEQMRLAGIVQRRMIPAKAPDIPGLDIAATYIPCFDVGGDFYDFVEQGEDNLVVVIADVIGKGVPAAIMTSSFRGAVRAYSDCDNCGRAIEGIVEKLNKMACSECRPGEFVSMFYAVINYKKMKMTYCNCGHEPTIMVRDGKQVDLDKGGLVLGVDEKAEYEIGSVNLKKDDSLIFYTDGLIDAANFDGDMWGREELQRIIKRHAGGTATNMVKEVLRYRRRFVGLAKQTDDTSIIVIKANG